MLLTRRNWISAASLATVLARTAQPGSTRVGCQANAWPLIEGNFDQLLDTVHEMKQLDYSGFECNIRFVKGQFGNIPAARAAIDQTGLAFIGAHSGIEQWARGGFDEAAASVAALGGQRMVVSAAGLSTDGHFQDVALQAKVARITALAQSARQEGIRLAYHNHNSEFANNNAEEERLAEETDPNLIDFLVDAGHGYLGGGDPARFALDHASRIFGIHIKTFRGTLQVPLGSGDFGFEKLAAALEQTKWTGWLITEEGGGSAKGNPAAVGPDRSYIKRVFGV